MDFSNKSRHLASNVRLLYIEINRIGQRADFDYQISGQKSAFYVVILFTPLGLCTIRPELYTHVCQKYEKKKEKRAKQKILLPISTQKLQF
jgi:hypothetical protein